MGSPHASIVVAAALCIIYTMTSSAVTPAGEISPVWTYAEPPPLTDLTCRAFILMEWQTGAILASKNAFTRMHPASLTKIMTALIALERGRLDDTIRVSAEAASQPGSSMYLREGDVFSLEDLLYGLMLNSGNDAAWAIAEHIGGTVKNFAAMMNTRARELGAINTRFENPHGLTDPNHYTTAFDLTLIARACLRHPFFRNLVATKEKDILEAEGKARITLQNTNRLLWFYLGADGIKTGTTEAAGQCLIASATRGSTRLLSVVLDSLDRWTDTARLLEYGFSNYRVEKVVAGGEPLVTLRSRASIESEVPIVCPQDMYVCIPRYALGLDVRLSLPQEITTPCSYGTVVGHLTVILDGQVVGYADLVCGTSLRPKGIAGRMARLLTRLACWLAGKGLL